jgi:hypothetical protein
MHMCHPVLYDLQPPGPLTFSYNVGSGLCTTPASNIDSCTRDSRLLLRYQACPDMKGTESQGMHTCPYIYLKALRARVCTLGPIYSLRHRETEYVHLAVYHQGHPETRYEHWSFICFRAPRNRVCTLDSI